MTLRRFSSRTERLDQEFLAKSLQGAKRYLRIAGYFRSSIFELVGEQMAAIPEVKILCNSELDLVDFQVASGRETALKERWNQVDVAAESLLHRERYVRLNALLKAGNVEIRVVPRERLFLHGKAGVITYADESRASFIGSVNETKSAFTQNHELVWQDDDPASADWVEEEFWALWEDGVPLPDTILAEIERVAMRREVSVEVLSPEQIPAAAMAEAPIYRGGEQLQPWQRSFVALFLKHRDLYGKARLLLADEVGVGKTLSMATSALVSSLLEDGPVLILAPSTLTVQWQVELKDRLGVPSAVWSSQKKVWIGLEGQFLSPKGHAEAIASCPYQIAIVSTGLIMHQREQQDFVKEAGSLLHRKYGTVILDEAHKARVRGGIGANVDDPNTLLTFMLQIGQRTRHLILGTATPVQTRVRELWDLLGILNAGADFVLGDALSPWRDGDNALRLVTGETHPATAEEAWQWLRNPLPPPGEEPAMDQILNALEIAPRTFYSAREFGELDYFVCENWLAECTAPAYFEQFNPVLRHVVLRRRTQLEEMGLLERVGVNTHPNPEKAHLYHSRFANLGLSTNTPFAVAYEKAEDFCRLLQQRTRAAGFMKSLMLQRLCSSFASGLATANRMLKHTFAENETEEQEGVAEAEHMLSDMSESEVECLQEIIRQLSRPEAVDPKLETVRWFLTTFMSEGKTWLEHGCIVFSQYYDTAFWVAGELAKTMPDLGVAVYAGAGKSGLYRQEEFVSVDRETIKQAVKTREIRLVVATDAACEGLNLQTLGTLINIDLPWNPSRLEQRLGRIKRFGQARSSVDMLNLVYNDTRDQTVYRVLSERLKDTFDIFGSLPDTIEADWIEDEEHLRDEMDIYMHKREHAENAFTVRYRDTVDPEANRWQTCSEVLSRKNIVIRMQQGWQA